ncbi:MAG: hypothetical protein UT94_C0024G0025 [Candidatus Uhrbacteria bacterium GW2011_GWF2_40_263]|nr:MAG: hypothetical protein UT94_C0024G0025 [Candidatus Uhrbacteria bacterium GW2011_GWF2_40_263]
MGKKRTYTITEAVRNPSHFTKDVPFDITNNGQIVATVISPKGANWYVCENCGENTQNIIDYQDDKLEWHKLILCDKCGEELL